MEELELTSDGVLRVLTHPTMFAFKSGIWYAINPPDDLVNQAPEHTLAGRLGLSQAALHAQLVVLGLGQNREATWKKTIGASIFFEKIAIGTRPNVHFIAFGIQPLFSPKDQIKPLSLLAQPAVVSKSIDAVAKLKRPRVASPEAQRKPAAATAAAASSAAASAASSSIAASGAGTPAPRRSKTLAEIFDALGCERPFLDSAGKALRPALLTRRFLTAYADMAPGSGPRAELLVVASAAVHAVLSLIAPDPLGTAAAIAVPRQRRVDADPLRKALVTAAQPKGRQLDKLIAGSPLAQSLIKSYRATVQRKEPMAVRAQILAPLTAQYSLRVFNECFELSLGPAAWPAKRHVWRLSRWHEAVWLAGQTPAASATPTWRLKGHEAILEAINWLTCGENLQLVAHGVRRVRNSAGDWIDLPATERIKCTEELWREFEACYGKDAKHVQRSKFIELAKLVAGTEQKSYGALDSYAEHNGRLPARDMRELSDEISTVARSLMDDSLHLPSGSRQRTMVANIVVHAAALKTKVTRVETFIKHDLPRHVPSCNDIKDEELACSECDDDDAAPAPRRDNERTCPTCPEHCAQCAFGGADDPSRCKPCDIKHSMRCEGCAEVHSLRPDFDLLLRAMDAALDAVETAVSGLTEEGAELSLARQSLQQKRESLVEVQLLIQRALVKFAAFHAHERRAAHERGVKQMLLERLSDDGFIMVADWKVPVPPAPQSLMPMLTSTP